MNGLVTDPVTMVYHELRSPLALVATMARSAADDCSDDYTRTRCLSIVRAAERMLRTAGHLMVVAETSSQATEFDFDPLDLVRRVTADYRAAGANVVLDCPSSGEVRAAGSASGFEALLCSLMGNALDHGGSEQGMRVTATTAGESCDVTIANETGRTGKHHGLGLGTYIGEKLARELGATIACTREGVTFIATIHLPVISRRVLEVAV